MYPILLQIGEFVLPAWHTFFVLGAIAAYILFVQLKKWFYPEISDRDLGNIYALGYLGGYFGARIFSIFNDQEGVGGFVEFIKALVSLGPMTFYGGFIGVTLVVAIYCRIKKVNLGKIADMALPAGLLGLAYGRIGCFLNGDDFGKPIANQDAWYGVVFPNLGDGILRFPTQIIETLFALGMVAILLILFKRFSWHKQRPGLIACSGSIGYSVYRFLAEYLRGDQRGWWVQDSISTSQGLSLIVIFATILLLIALRRSAGNYP